MDNLLDICFQNIGLGGFRGTSPCILSFEFISPLGFSLPELWQEIEADIEEARAPVPRLDEFTRQWCFDRFVTSPLVDFYLSTDEPVLQTDERELYA